jgi:hypothetical protein
MTGSTQNTQQTARWPSFVFRGFGIANFLFACLGLLFLASTVSEVRERALGNTSEYPYFLLAFWTMTTVNLLFLTLLVFAGIRLLQVKSLGVAVCDVVFAAEMAYFMTLGILWGAVSLPSVSSSIAAATGLGSVGVSPQVICGYPLLALIFLNLARRRLQTIT